MGLSIYVHKSTIPAQTLSILRRMIVMPSSLFPSPTVYPCRKIPTMMFILVQSLTGKGDCPHHHVWITPCRSWESATMCTSERTASTKTLQNASIRWRPDRQYLRSFWTQSLQNLLATWLDSLTCPALGRHPLISSWNNQGTHLDVSQARISELTVI